MNHDISKYVGLANFKIDVANFSVPNEPSVGKYVIKFTVYTEIQI